ncbi:MAG: hypothetical protein ACRCVU_10940 [Flavobacterium sp.]
MKRKLKITSCIIIIASLAILGFQLYFYNDNIDAIQQLNTAELDKEILISNLMLIIGLTMFLRSTRIKE